MPLSHPYQNHCFQWTKVSTHIGIEQRTNTGLLKNSEVLCFLFIPLSHRSYYWFCMLCTSTGKSVIPSLFTKHMFFPLHQPQGLWFGDVATVSTYILINVMICMVPSQLSSNTLDYCAGDSRAQFPRRANIPINCEWYVLC